MKHTNNFTRRTMPILAILVPMLMSGAAAFAQTTTFTYQGKLTDGAQAASGSYDLLCDGRRMVCDGRRMVIVYLR